MNECEVWKDDCLFLPSMNLFVYSNLWPCVLLSLHSSTSSAISHYSSFSFLAWRICFAFFSIFLKRISPFIRSIPWAADAKHLLDLDLGLRAIVLEKLADAIALCKRVAYTLDGFFDALRSELDLSEPEQ